ncbi:quinone-dependent dihydroorotate dehydrogenase [Alphaproteobacteria bacterium LSUCC0684]
MIWPAAAALARYLPGEAAHRLAVRSLALGIGPRVPADLYGDRLVSRIGDLTVLNPLGLAAGFDKDAEAMSGALALGFGAVEVGTITPKPQPGNPKPRVFRLAEDGAVINRYGFNNSGMVRAAARLRRFRQSSPPGQKPHQLIGVNIGANKDSPDRVADYHMAASCLAPYSDYMTVNVSSPNTPGLRGLQEPAFLTAVLEATSEGIAAAGVSCPLLLKLAPDLDEAGLAAAIEVAENKGIAGLIIANTTISRPDGLRGAHRHETGGLSGTPLFQLSTSMLHRAHRLTWGRLPLVAAGGVACARSAYAKILLGASFVQIYTGLALKGPHLPGEILSGLNALMLEDGYGSISDAKGSASRMEEALRRCWPDRGY